MNGVSNMVSANNFEAIYYLTFSYLHKINEISNTS